ncbi:hypothetical protein N7456_006683 [Penicillium angulare]|uniref:C2H2-type domain-containing protein n=1 Tax=Penicillium angulare TaxID=116970 RepID=A0A9W9FI54_9EURO|nr:hypothetical protein N7456_006683 [Penicillium angulare]
MSEATFMYIFVARATSTAGTLKVSRSVESTRERLAVSLQSTKRMYIERYGPMLSEPRDFTFVRGSNQGMGPDSVPAKWFRENLDEAQRDGRNVIVVINGFDGLTTDTMSFDRLFRQHAGRTRIRVLDREERWFYEVDVQGVLDEFDGLVESDELEASTCIFVEKFKNICAEKIRLSEAKRGLNFQTHNRNSSGQTNALDTYECSKCTQVFQTYLILCVHHRNSHRDETYICVYCNVTFDRPDVCKKHIRKCPKLPDDGALAADDGALASDDGHSSSDDAVFSAGESPSSAKRARREPALAVPESLVTVPESPVTAPVSPVAVVVSPVAVAQSTRPVFDTALIAYDDLTADMAKRLPHLSWRLPEEDLYKGEVFCRVEGCRFLGRKYSTPSKLRRHLDSEHGVFDRPHACGKFNLADQAIEDAGVEWLARCAQIGVDAAGPRPVRRKVVRKPPPHPIPRPPGE